MKGLRKGFELFCYRNRDKAIPNLMLYIVLGSGLVYLMTQFMGNYTLYNLLCFDRDLILKGQVWRLVTYVLTYQATSNNFLLVAISLFCFYSLGRAIENVWGALRFNLFYFTGIILMDLYAMLLGGIAVNVVSEGAVLARVDASSIYTNMAYYLNLSLLISYATLYPDAHFLLFYIIPVKAWIFGLLDLVLTLYSVYEYTFLVQVAGIRVSLFPHNLFPLVAIANYFLFFGSDVKNLIPLSWRSNASRLFKKKPKKATVKNQGPVPFPSAAAQQPPRAKAAYTHRCTICGKTDQSNPELEFRYCSRCNGYFCYCQDHISNHTHVE